MSICPECIVPTSSWIHRTSDIYGHGLAPNPACTANSLDIFGQAIRLLEDPTVRAVLPFLTEDFTYGDETARFLVRDDLDRLPNIYILFLLHYFIQPTTSFTPLASEALMASAKTPNSKPRPEIGPQRKENVEFMQKMALAYQTAVAIEIVANNKTLPISGSSTTYETFQDNSAIEVVTKYKRNA
jgi:hypothetical protein